MDYSWQPQATFVDVLQYFFSHQSCGGTQLIFSKKLISS
jgi:hypothetical protein